MPLLTDDELSEIIHQYGNEVFGAKLIVKNLTHIITSSQSSEDEKLKCRELLELLLVKIDYAQTLTKKMID